jgi:hypothetical protein
MNLSAHEAGHVLIATVLGYQASAYVLPHRGRYTVKGRVIDPTHRACIGLGGALGELMIDRPLATRDEAQRFVIESGRVSTTDWQMIGDDPESCFHGLWLAVDILREHHAALLQIAEVLREQGQITTEEVQALCHKSS